VPEEQSVVTVLELHPKKTAATNAQLPPRSSYEIKSPAASKYVKQQIITIGEYTYMQTLEAHLLLPRGYLSPVTGLNRAQSFRP
jgi:hypothetical protein